MDECGNHEAEPELLRDDEDCFRGTVVACPPQGRPLIAF
eukprot:COSAG05_NODE_661_length_8043_cov_22.502014_3_plen_39_part_00